MTARRFSLGFRRSPDRAEDTAGDRWVERRITVIWTLLFFNVLTFLPGITILPIPRPAGQALATSALAVAVVLAMVLNPKLLVRPNVVLGLATLLAATSLMISMRGDAGPSSIARCVRLAAFLLVLWLLTPWWGRGMMLVRCHLRALSAVCASVFAGILVAPSSALQNRLTGVLWPIPPPQVAQYAAMAAGIAIVLWLTGAGGRGQAMVLGGGGVMFILLSQTRTALLAFTAGIAVAGLTMFYSNRRVRKVAAAFCIAAPLTLVALAPTFSSWFTRDQSSEELRGLTGRTQAWSALVAAPRSEFNQWFGYGLSDKSFDGRAIDSTWLAVYQDQGLVGIGIVAALIAVPLIAAGFRPPGPERAVATFIVVYCLCASYTEVGLGDASPYLLHIALAASLLVSEAVRPCWNQLHPEPAGTVLMLPKASES